MPLLTKTAAMGELACLGQAMLQQTECSWPCEFVCWNSKCRGWYLEVGPLGANWVKGRALPNGTMPNWIGHSVSLTKHNTHLHPFFLRCACDAFCLKHTSMFHHQHHTSFEKFLPTFGPSSNSTLSRKSSLSVQSFAMCPYLVLFLFACLSFQLC